MDSDEKNVAVVEAAKVLGKAPTFVRRALQTGKVPWGFAVQKQNGRWSYHISPGMLKAYVDGTMQIHLEEPVTGLELDVRDRYLKK